MSVRFQKEIRDWLVTILMGVILAIFIHKMVFALYVVEGTSMMPTLKDHERVVVSRLPTYFSTYKHGSIVIFPSPVDGRNFVKRVIGLPGDKIEILDGRVYRNGEALHESYVDMVTEGDVPATIVKEDHVFVMGDNRGKDGSLDSRSHTIGQIPISAIKGEVKFVLYPLPRGIK